MIAPDDIVALHYALWLDDDADPVESTFDDEPEKFRFGRGELPASLERRISNLAVGDIVEFLIPANESAFGVWDPEKRHVVSRDSFAGVDCRPGALVEFELPNGDRVSGRIDDVDDERVTVDFNNPLIGRDVNCRVELIAVTADKMES